MSVFCCFTDTSQNENDPESNGLEAKMASGPTVVGRTEPDDRRGRPVVDV